MVGKVIRDYMEGGAKKLTVPGFGTFMRREGAQDGNDGGSAHGDIIFVDLLRGDDKTLSELVEDHGGYTELEAMARIDRWIFETRNAVERNGSAVIAGFGTLTIDHKGVYKFHHSPTPRPTKETAVQERLFEVGTPPPSVGRPTSTPPKEGNTAVRGGEKVAGTASHSRFPSSGGAARSAGVVKISPQKRPTARPSRMDTVLIVAIIAAAIALVALIFGMSSGNMPFLSK